MPKHGGKEEMVCLSTCIHSSSKDNTDNSYNFFLQAATNSLGKENGLGYELED